VTEAKTPHDEALAARIHDSPIYKLLGMQLESLGAGHSRIRLPVDARFHQLQGAVHGGITATLVDSCVGTALLTLVPLGYRALTVEMKLNYLAPVVEGELVGEGHIVHKGGRLALGESEVRDLAGQLVAKGLVTYMALPPAKG
jgi:uncharacterized protein (TIGR00369 family)